MLVFPLTFGGEFSMIEKIKGFDKEEYTYTIPRENDSQAEKSFAYDMWKVALEPEVQVRLVIQD